MSRSCYMNIRDLRRLRPIFDNKTACTLNSHLNCSFHARLLQFLFYSINSSPKNACKQCRTVLPAQSRKLTNITHNSCPKITSLAKPKRPSKHLLQNSISYLQILFKPLNPLTLAKLFTAANRPGPLAHHHILSFSISA